MTKKMLIIKFAPKIEFLTDLLNGKIYMNREEYFRKSDVPEQGDKHDGGILSYDAKIFVGQTKDELYPVNGIEEVFVTSSANPPIFCFAAIEREELLENVNFVKYFKDTYNSKYFLIFKDFNEVKKDITEYGKVNNIDIYGGHVKYYDSKTFSPSSDEIDSIEIFFLKEKRYEIQREFRILAINEDILAKDGPFIVNLNKTYEGWIYKIQDDYSIKQIFSTRSEDVKHEEDKNFTAKIEELQLR